MRNELYWYVLFVRTGSEERLAEKLRERLDADKHKPFVMKGEKIYRRQGVKEKRQTPCFPGYIFIESCESSADFIKSINPLIRSIEGLYRLLSYGNDSEVAVKDSERLTLNALFGDAHCIEVPRILKEGDTVKVISGTLAGHESKIVRLDKHGVVIHFEMFGQVVEVVLGVELVKRVVVE